MKLDEIARLAGVSRTTASYVINGKAKQYRVSDKTVDKVMAVVREHNYHPNAVAAGLRAGRTRSIGLVIPDLKIPATPVLPIIWSVRLVSVVTSC